MLSLDGLHPELSEHRVVPQHRQEAWNRLLRGNKVHNEGGAEIALQHRQACVAWPAIQTRDLDSYWMYRFQHEHQLSERCNDIVPYVLRCSSVKYDPLTIPWLKKSWAVPRCEVAAETLGMPLSRYV